MFKGEKVIMRAYRKDDTAQAYEYFNILEGQYMLNPGIIGPISLQEEEKYIEMATSCNKERTGHYALETIEGQYIGGCSYMQRDSKSGFCYIGIAIPDKKYQNKGHGTDAMKVLLNYLYFELNIRKVLLNVFAYNKNAIKCYKVL